MALPIVAVVGRPNVGKSTLVNRIALSKDAIVHEQRGVTRDRSYHRADWNGRFFTLIDTGGIEMAADDVFQGSIRNQALLATEEADVIIFMVDSRIGLTADDVEVARLIKRSKRPVILAVNKMDNPAKEDELWEFFNLGLGDPWPISSVHGHGTGDMLDELVALLPSEEECAEEETSDINIAIIGRPNAGKSSLTNRLVGKERSIVSDVAGTTRDAVDTV
ncbi:MAG TPA: ribosome biogenesis GTPase Der, partial [Coriobacteriia bacterium]|nr:ribosome biogenesis GTPase Der [Coriobacteriia bacterium]